MKISIEEKIETIKAEIRRTEAAYDAERNPDDKDELESELDGLFHELVELEDKLERIIRSSEGRVST